jgi:hypothetical protein
MPWRLGFADFESGDGFAGGAGVLDEEFVFVVDAEGVAGGFDGQGAAGVGHADVDALSGNDKGAAGQVEPDRRS